MGEKTCNCEGEVQEDRNVGGGSKVWILTRFIEHLQRIFLISKKTAEGKK